MAKVTKTRKAALEKVKPGKSLSGRRRAEAREGAREGEVRRVRRRRDQPRHRRRAKSDQVVRGSTVLPNGNGKKVRVAVFAQGANAEAAKQAGADVVGMEDLAERIKGGDLNFNVVIASPDAMRVVGKLGQLLGPRGLMPNPKVGTVSPDVARRGAQREVGPGPLPRRQGRHRALPRSAT